MTREKRSLSIHGHRTSIALEPEFWAVIDAHIDQSGQSLAGFLTAMDDRKNEEKSMRGLASYLRVWVVRSLQAKANTSD